MTRTPRRTPQRTQQHLVIAADPRIISRARHTQTALIEDVAQMCGVSRGAARRIIHNVRRERGIARTK